MAGWLGILKQPNRLAVVGDREHLPLADVEADVAVHVGVVAPEMNALGEFAQIAALSAGDRVGAAESGDQCLVGDRPCGAAEKIDRPCVVRVRRKAGDVRLRRLAGRVILNVNRRGDGEFDRDWRNLIAGNRTDRLR